MSIGVIHIYNVCGMSNCMYIKVHCNIEESFYWNMATEVDI